MGSGICPLCSFDSEGKQMMFETGLMRISKVSDEKAAFPSPLSKLGNTGGAGIA